MIYNQILEVAPIGTVIPKPAAKSDFLVKGIGKRRGETALIYTIPNHKKPQRPYQKGITKSEFEITYQELINTGTFSRKWFNANMTACNNEGGCNFTMIGGLFVLLGEAEYAGHGEYKRKYR